MEVSTDTVTSQPRIDVRGMKGWMKFLGIMNIISGAFSALSIIGIVFAWLPIWLGIILLQAGSRAQEYVDRGDEAALAGFTGKLRTYFTISGVLLIVSLGLGIISSIVWIVLVAGGLVALPSLSDYLNQ